MSTPADRPLRVLHVLDSLAPGGLENGVVNTARRLHGHGFDIHAACLRFRGDFAERLHDCAGCFTAIWIADGNGCDPIKVWDVRDELIWVR